MILFIGCDREGLFPTAIEQIAGRGGNFLDLISANRENAAGLGCTLCICGQLADNITGRINLSINFHGVGASVDYLEFCACQCSFALCSLSGHSIVLFNAYRTKQINVDRLVNTPVAIGHIR